MSETTETGGRIRDYLWHDNGEDKAQVDDRVGVDNVVYLHSDHLLKTRVATDQGQQVVWRWEGEAFGEMNAVELAVTKISLRFPGQYFDEETNLHYNHFRYYDSSLGRYIQSDPIGLRGGMNTYAYVNGNPLAYADHYGLAHGDPYDSGDLAGANAQNDVNYQSIKEGREFAGRVYQNPDGTYFYTSPIPGTKDSSWPGDVPQARKILETIIHTVRPIRGTTMKKFHQLIEI